MELFIFMFVSIPLVLFLPEVISFIRWFIRSSREDSKRASNERERLTGEADYFYNKACRYSLRTDIDRCLRDLTKAIELDPSCRERAKQERDLGWARHDRQVREVLGLPSER